MNAACLVLVNHSTLLIKAFQLSCVLPSKLTLWNDTAFGVALFVKEKLDHVIHVEPNPS